jgi:hypothetical protein
MQALLPTDILASTLSLPTNSTSNQLLDSCELQRLRDRLRLTYGLVEAPLPARLAELVERLARWEQAED